MSKINYLLLIIISSFFMSYCSKADLNDYRENYAGSYSGIQITTYYYLDPVDTSLAESVQDTQQAEIRITLAECEDCVGIIYDTPENGMITDTVNLTEDGVFESSFKLIGETYYRYYNVYFEDDSLMIGYDWRGSNEMFSYIFKGRKLLHP